ncbi:hypothetical protein HDV03_000832 [Kappamyces sp. JEL0829]|nr:hypothetical protein HDV03_000832 [Kappamyces sp. JEL0829]
MPEYIRKLEHLIKQSDSSGIKMLMKQKRITAGETNPRTGVPYLFTAMLQASCTRSQHSYSSLAWFLEECHDIQVRDEHGNSALLYAIQLQDAVCVNLVLEKPNSKKMLEHANNQGITPFLLACRLGQIATVDKLEQLGVSLTVSDLKDDTGLHLACAYARPHLIAHLISKGLDPTKKNAKGFSCFDYCFSKEIGEYTKACWEAFATRLEMPGWQRQSGVSLMSPNRTSLTLSLGIKSNHLRTPSLRGTPSKAFLLYSD